MPRDVVFCRNCVVSNQRPRTRFNEDGICSACQWAYEKDHSVDWASRAQELEALCDKYRSKDGSFDVIVPCSGGKDSGYVAHQMRDRYGMHPLCVTWSPFEYTDIGWQNFRNWIEVGGFDNVSFKVNGRVQRLLTRLAIENLLHPFQTFILGQKNLAPP